LVVVVQLAQLMVGEVLVAQILYLALLHPQAVVVVEVVEPRPTILLILGEMVVLVVEWVVVQQQHQL
jgi:hypothetical protein